MENKWGQISIVSNISENSALTPLFAATPLILFNSYKIG